MRSKTKVSLSRVGANPIDEITEVIVSALRDSKGSLDLAALQLEITTKRLSEAMHQYGIQIRRGGEVFSPRMAQSSQPADRPSEPTRDALTREDLVRALHEEDNHRGRAAERLGVSLSSLVRFMQRLDVQTPPREIITEEQLRHALAQNEGDQAQVADLFGVSIPTIAKLRQRYGMTSPYTKVVTKEQLEEALAQTEGHRAQAAERLQISSATFYRLIERYGISLDETKSSTRPVQISPEALERTLQQTGGHRGQTAELLQVSPSTLDRLLERYGMQLDEAHPKNRPVQISKEALERTLRQTGYHRDQTAKIFGISAPAVSKLMERYGMDSIRTLKKAKIGWSDPSSGDDGEGEGEDWVERQIQALLEPMPLRAQRLWIIDCLLHILPAYQRLYPRQHYLKRIIDLRRESEGNSLTWDPMHRGPYLFPYPPDDGDTAMWAFYCAAMANHASESARYAARAMSESQHLGLAFDVERRWQLRVLRQYANGSLG